MLRKFSGLVVLQGANLLLPLLIYPYLTRCLGPSSFGEFSVSQAIAQYFVLFVDFGFNLTGARAIALAGADRQKVNRIYWTVFWAKGFLVGISALVVLALFFAMRDATLSTLVLLQFPIVIGTWLFPLWLFQGLERLGLASSLSFSCRLTVLPLILLFVHSPKDLHNVALMFGLSGMLLALVGVATTWKVIAVRPVRISRNEVRQKLLEAWPLFLSAGSSSLYVAANIVLLRLVAPSSEVGYFAAADKLRAAAVGLIPIMTNLLFPGSARSSEAGWPPLREALRRYSPKIALGVLLFLGMLVPAKLFISIIFGHQMEPAVAVLRIMSFSALFIPISHIAGIHLLVARGYSKQFARVLLASGSLNLVLAPLLGKWFHAVGVASAIVIVEMVVAGGLVATYRRYRARFTQPDIRNLA